MDIEKYCIENSLTKLELENLYNSSTEKARVEITKEFNKGTSRYSMPRHWGELVIKNGSLSEKIALAKHGIFLNQEDLVQTLKNDKDILIRCALYENEYFHMHEQEELFKSSSHIERLAMMRNPKLDERLILKIYNVDKNEFNLSDDERKELIFALCINKEFIKKITHEPGHWAFFELNHWNESFCEDLYDEAFKWRTKDPKVARITFGTFPCPADKKLEIYRKLKDDDDAWVKALRAALFESIPYDVYTKKDTFDAEKYNELCKEGLLDKDSWVREHAAEKVGKLSRRELRNLLSQNDEFVIRGLASNESLDSRSIKLVANKRIENAHSDKNYMELPFAEQDEKFHIRHRKIKKIDDIIGSYGPSFDDIKEAGDFSKASYIVLVSFKNFINMITHRIITIGIWVSVIFLLLFSFISHHR